MTDDPITALLDQLAEHAERIGRLDTREAEHFAALTTQIAMLASLAGGAGSQAAVLTADPGADAAGSDQAGDDHSGSRAADAYAPAPARRWWKLAGEDRAQAITTLRAWVEQVYRPGYGHLAAPVGACWEQHPLCLYAMDILAELWSVLYLTRQRTPALLSAQAEYQARILPALAAQMNTETTRCTHARDRITPASHTGRTR